MRKILAPVVGMLFMIGLMFGTIVPAHAEVGDSGDNGCTSSTYSSTGDGNGHPIGLDWSRSYNANCNNYTKGTISIHVWNRVDSNNDHHLMWDASITAGPIAGNNCIQVAFDWANPQGHSDNQIMRNCYENSTRQMPTQDIAELSYDNSNWKIAKIQISVYDPDNGTVQYVVCPKGDSNDPAPDGTDTNAGCIPAQGGYAPNGSFSTVGAKIYRRTNTGQDQQNAPIYPDGAPPYTIWKQVDPNS